MQQQLGLLAADPDNEYIAILHGARTVNWCQIPSTTAGPGQQQQQLAASATSLRAALVALIRGFWTTGAGKSQGPTVAIQASEALREAVASPSQLRPQTVNATAWLLSDIVHSIIDVYRARTASLPPYPSPPGLLDSQTPPDIPQANVVAAKSVQLLSSLVHANQLLLTRAGLRRSPQPDREQTAAILRVILEVSAVSVCNPAYTRALQVWLINVKPVMTGPGWAVV